MFSVNRWLSSGSIFGVREMAGVKVFYPVSLIKLSIIKFPSNVTFRASSSGTGESGPLRNYPDCLVSEAYWVTGALIYCVIGGELRYCSSR